MTVEHDLFREEGFVMLHAGVVDTGHVGCREHAHHARHLQRRPRAQGSDPAVCLRHLDRIGVQHVLGALHQVIGVERAAGDMQAGALMRQRKAYHRLLGTVGQLAHDLTASVVCAYSLSRLWPSMAER
ncbi:hypothetical protein M2160_009290 [Streptomyces sp. SAI-117]|nr:hypothetical protein [Streptomyces sp. SAI-117]